MGLGNGELCDLAQPLGPHERRVDRRGEGGEGLVGADVRVGAGAADVLLARPERQNVGELALLVHGLPADAPRKLADKLRLRRHVPGVRPAEEERHAQGLRLPHRDVRPKLAGSFEDGERDRVAHRDRQRPDRVRGLRRRPHVLDDAEVVRVLDEDARDVLGYVRKARRPSLEGQFHSLDAVGLYYLAVPGVQAPGDGDPRVALRLAGRHQGGLGDGVRAVVDGGIGDLKSRQLGDYGLVLEDRLEDALADLRLVRRVGGQELPARGDGPDGRGGDPVVSSGSQKDRQPGYVPPRQPLDICERLVLGEGGRQIQLPLELRRDVGEEIVHRPRPYGREHLLDVAFGVRCESRHAVVPPWSSGERSVFPPCPKPESVTPSAPARTGW